ncbi:MAG: ATP-binding protein, partial [Candidatus Nitrosocosmicus sp.]
MSSDDLLTIKTGELLAKTEELQEVNQSLDILNGDVNKKINEIKQAKQDLKNSDNQLLIANDKLTETNEKFAAVNKELAAVNKEVFILNKQVKSHQEKQNEFINIISHELKTPIQAIIGYVELLLEQPEKKFEYGEQIMRNAERLQKMISDIRDMSKIDNNALTLNKEQFNLIEVLSSTVNDIKEHLIPDNKRVNIVYNNAAMVDKDLIIEADKERIIQVISNLLDNAIKFTKEGTIHIDIEKSGGNDNDKDDSDGNNNNNNNNNNNKSGEIIINIKDTGKGLDSRAFPHLFSKFFSTSGAGGTGLGLYICKSIVEAHGGRIWAKNNNEDEKGATF